MTELEQILRIHARRYPGMQPADAVKLIYQNEFGGGHLIRDEEMCLNYLRAEYESIAGNDTDAPYEEIGNGIVRVYLAPLNRDELETLGRDFIRSASEHAGCMERFLQKLEVLVRLTGEGVFSFDSAQLEEYLTGYRKAGCPMVSHSEQYRRYYRPAYRIILMRYVHN